MSRWCVNGQWAGEKGKSLQIEAVEIQVADIAYLAHVQGSGDTVWMADGMTAGTTGSALRLEALRIKSQHCGNIEAQAHIQDEGWIDYGTVNQNILIGTAGEKKRLECLRLKGNFEWRAHIQGTGWTQWTRADGRVHSWHSRTVSQNGSSRNEENIKISGGHSPEKNEADVTFRIR